VYIGYGIKAATPCYQPNQPEDIQDEPEDFVEHYEPVPKKAPIPKAVEGEGGEEGAEDD